MLTEKLTVRRLGLSYGLDITEKYLWLNMLRNSHRRKRVQPAARCFHVQVNILLTGGGGGG
jgi:hypothetical protein